MQELLRNINNFDIHYYNVFPEVTETEEIKKRGIITNLNALVYSGECDEMKSEDRISISERVTNIPIMFACKSKHGSDYKLYFYFNGIKLEVFSSSVFTLLKYLHDKGISKDGIMLNILGYMIEASSKPDEDSNFFIRLDNTVINELKFSLNDVLSCLSLSPKNLDTRHSICELKSDLSGIIPLPLSEYQKLNGLILRTSNIIQLKKNYGYLPPLCVYAISDNGKSIRSRFFNTEKVIMEEPASPIEAAMIHHLMINTNKKLKYDTIRHYQGEKIKKPTRVLTKIDPLRGNSTAIMTGGQVFTY